MSLRLARPLCVVLAAGMLNGCGWFDGWFGGKASPLQSAPLRPGADKQAVPSGLPPAPTRGSYDAGVVPLEDGRSQAIGSVVSATGGQKAQLEKIEKERAQQDAEREKERALREAERDREKAAEPRNAPPASSPPSPAPDQTPAPPVAEPSTTPPR